MRRRRRRVRQANTSAVVIQIGGLALVLVMILLFRDAIGTGAGQFLDSFSAPDVRLPDAGSAPSSEDAGADDHAREE